jgi:hypothetical protein
VLAAGAVVAVDEHAAKMSTAPAPKAPSLPNFIKTPPLIPPTVLGG